MNEDYMLMTVVITIVFLITVFPLLLMWLNEDRITALEEKVDQNIESTIFTERAKLNINTRKKTIYTASFISIITVLSLVLFCSVHHAVVEKIKPIEVDWIKTDSLNIKSGPIWFYYNSKDGKISSLHNITENDKSLLISLVESNDKLHSSYCKAIDKLAYLSNKNLDKSLYCWLVLLYGVCGLIGVLLRTINNFIGVSCFKNDFNFHRWWPWYFMRPLLGFITGAVVFLLIDGKQLVSGELSGGISKIVLAIAFVGGFSADDFYELLRKISKRIFSSS